MKPDTEPKQPFNNVLTPTEAAACAFAMRAAMCPGSELYIPEGWNVILAKLDHQARTCDPKGVAEWALNTSPADWA